MSELIADNALSARRASVIRVLDAMILSCLFLFLFSTAFSIALTEIGYFSALTFWVCRMVYARSIDWPRTPLDGYFLAFVGAEILAMLFAEHKAYALLYLQRRVLLLPIVYTLAANIRDRTMLLRLFIAMVLSAVGVGLWGMQDVLSHLGEFIHFQRRLAEFQMVLTSGGIMMIILLMLIPFLLHKRTPIRVRWTIAGSLFLLSLNLLFTFTRSSWLGLLAGIAVIGIMRSRKIFLPVAAAMVLLLVVSSPEMRDRITSIVDPSHPNNITRVHMWTVGLRIMKDYPIIGIGDVGIETVWYTYADPAWNVEGHLHNNVIMWMVTLGALGCIVLFALFVRLWRMVASIEREMRDDWLVGSLAVGALAVLAGFHVNGLFEWNFGDAEIITLVWIITGLVLAGARIVRRERAA